MPPIDLVPLKRAALVGTISVALPLAGVYVAGLEACLRFLASGAGGLTLVALSLLTVGLACRRVVGRWSRYTRKARLLAGGACVVGGLGCFGVTLWEGSGRMLPPELAQRRAEMLLAHGHGRMALRWMEQAARGGHLEAQVYLAKAYQNGQVRHDGALVALIPESKPMSARWYRRVAETLRARAKAGLAEAQFQLGTLYLTGHGVDQDKELAAGLFAQAAAQEHPKGHLWVSPALAERELSRSG